MSNLAKVKHLISLLRTQWADSEYLHYLQLEKLKIIVKHAYENTVLYKQKFDEAGFDPASLKHMDDLKKLPFVSKMEIKENYPDKIIAKGRDLKKCWVSRTGGSTGIPLTVVYDEEAEDFQKAVSLRANLSVGQSFFDRWAVITSPEHIVNEKAFQKLGLFAPQYLSLFDELQTQVSFLEKFKPDVLDGYPTSIYMIAYYLKKKDFFKLNPKLIFTTAEVLTEGMRRSIEDVFGVKVFDQFGAVEMGRTAWECEVHKGYHIDSEAVIMEFLRMNGKDAEPGERGEIVYTNLYNYAMPLIRYRIGDIGIPSGGKCPCGRGLPVMDAVEGRSDSFFQIPEGRVFSPIIWPVLLRPFDVVQYKIEQPSLNQVIVEFVDEKNIPGISNLIRERIKTYLNSSIEIVVNKVDIISRGSSNKLRCALSHVDIDWTNARM